MKGIRRSVLAYGIATITAAALACGGVDSTLFDGAGDGGSDASSDARSTRDAGRSTNDAAVGDGGRVFDSGGGGSDGGGTRSGIVPTVCGSTLSCSSGDPTCCGVQSSVLLATSTYSCTANPSQCSAVDGGAPIGCRDNTDCVGSAVCCGELFDPSGAGGYEFITCESSCVADNDAGVLTSHVPFCTIGQLPDVCAQWGLTCMASQIFPGFSVCGGD